MAIFNISFRIKQVGNHAARYDSVVEKIKAEAAGQTSWEETTSFFVLESNKTASSLCDSIYVNSEFNGEWDKMLVVNLSVSDHASRGKLDYPNTLNGLMSRR
jgi:hypothetical protein